MAYVPSTRWTVLDVLSLVRELTKTIEQKKVLVDQGRYFYNVALSEIVAVLNGSLDPAYFVTETYVTTPDGDIWDIGDVVVNITNNTFHKDAEADPFLPGMIAVVSFYDADTFSFCVRIVSTSNGGKDAVYEPIFGTEVDPSGHSGQVILFNSASATTISMLNLSYEVDRIVQIYDTVYGQCVYVQPGEYFSIGRAGFEHKSYDNDIVYTIIGNTVYLKNGAKITNPGTKTVIYQRQPNYPTLYDSTEYVDIADKYVPLLVKRIYTYVILQLENDVPKNLAQEMQSDYAQISAFAGSEIANRNQKPEKERSR